jgi:DNA-binding CsgD family transcriptional regulator
VPSRLTAGGLPANTAEVLSEVAGIAGTPGGMSERADALLAVVGKVVPFDAGWIALLPPGRRIHVPLSRRGYDDRVRSYLDSPDVLADIELTGMHRSSRPVRGPDSPVPLSEVPGWAEYLEPAGFREGLSVGLFGPDGRYLGVLAVHTCTAVPATQEAYNLVGLLAGQIATAVDPLRSIATIAGIVHSATAGIVLTPAGTVLPLPGLPDHVLLARGSDVLEVAAAGLAEGSVHTSFLAQLPGAGAHVRITVLAAPPDVQFFAAAVVLISPPGELYGLSPRELQVLGVLVTGASNQQMAAALGITGRTIAVHVEHARTKLAASSRTAAASRALRLGLFVPHGLLAAQNRTSQNRTSPSRTGSPAPR